MSFRVPDTPASSVASGSSFVFPTRPTRKRVNSFIDEPSTPSERKRPRVSDSLTPNRIIRAQPTIYDLCGLSDTSAETSDVHESPRLDRYWLRPRILRAAASMGSISAAGPTDMLTRTGIPLTRTNSEVSLRDSPRDSKHGYAVTSAFYHLRSGRTSIDFAPTNGNMWPVGWSPYNVMLFGRGNRVHYKSLMGNEEIGQLCKIQDKHGALNLVECGGKDQAAVAAVSTTKGHIQIWDVLTKTMIMSWTCTEPTAMKWNGPVLTVGNKKGAIRHYDTRIKEVAKMKDQTKKVTRHQVKICSLAWHDEQRYFASGDDGGTVLVWDIRQKAPLDAGEKIQRRKKMQHDGSITALAWCTWQSKILAAGDSVADGSGNIRIWNVYDSPAFHPSGPDRIKLDAQVTSLHFSPHCKELLSTHGPGKTIPVSNIENQIGNDTSPRVPYSTDPPPTPVANSVVVYSYPSLKQVTALSATKSIAGSVLSPNGQKIVLAVPDEGKLKVWDVWGKTRELRRTSSSLSCSIR